MSTPDPEHAKRTLQRSIVVWCVLGAFLVFFSVAGLVAPAELANANISITPTMLTLAGLHGALLVVTALASLTRNQIPIIISIVLILLALLYPMSFKSPFGGIVVGIVAVNAGACLWTVRTTDFEAQANAEP